MCMKWQYKYNFEGSAITEAPGIRQTSTDRAGSDMATQVRVLTLAIQCSVGLSPAGVFALPSGRGDCYDISAIHGLGGDTMLDIAARK